MIKYCKISELCKIYGGNSINEKIKKEKYTNNNGIEYISTKDIGYNLKINYNNGIKIPNSDLEKFRIAPPHTVFICAEGGSAGRKLAISDRQLCFVNKLFAIVSTEKVLPKFIFYFIQSDNFNKQFKSAITGLIGGVSLNKFKEFEIPILPILTQQKIVAKLDKIFAEIDKATAAAEANISNSHDLYSSSVTSFFKKLTDETVKLSSCSEIGYGYTSKSSIKFIGPKYLRITDIQNNRVNWSLVPNINKDLNKVKKFLLKEGDIVFARTGATTGKSYLVKNSPTSVFASYLIRVDANRDVVNPDYLRHFFQSKDYWNVINSGISGSAQGGFNASKLKKLKFPLPNKIKQVEIIKKLNEIEKFSLLYKNLQQKKIYQFNKLKQSILQQAFNGELVKAV